MLLLGWVNELRGWSGKISEQVPSDWNHSRQCWLPGPRCSIWVPTSTYLYHRWCIVSVNDLPFVSGLMSLNNRARFFISFFLYEGIQLLSLFSETGILFYLIDSVSFSSKPVLLSFYEYSTQFYFNACFFPIWMMSSLNIICWCRSGRRCDPQIIVRLFHFAG